MNSSTAGDDSHSGYITVSPPLCSCNIPLYLYFFVCTSASANNHNLLKLQWHFVAITIVTGISSLVIETFGGSKELITQLMWIGTTVTKLLRDLTCISIMIAWVAMVLLAECNSLIGDL